ncbi:hypothetical protein DPMN_110560 [Dreissena polymorpha]|uniref:Uncharacterized protein n=1 Tax=Dreissena polymorpha TaxID=45954 RepID=A0A9D4QP29_DREPO|nr:hypothetical protein DPMN_110560 [Dreissena polymorpha]
MVFAFKMSVSVGVKTGSYVLRWCQNGSIALPELLSNWLICPAEVTGHQKLHSMTDPETALNTRPVVSRGSVSLQVHSILQVQTLITNSIEDGMMTRSLVTTNDHLLKELDETRGRHQHGGESD